MEIELERHCDRNLLSLLYLTLLGRNADPENAWLGAPLSEVAGGILASQEFSAIAEACLNLDFAERQERKSRRERISLAEQLVQVGAPVPRTFRWHDLLLSALEWLNVVLPEESRPASLGPVMGVLKTEFSNVVDIAEQIDEKFQFNPTWFVVANDGLPELDEVGADIERFAVRAVLDGQAELSPFFSIAGAEQAELRSWIFGSPDQNTHRSIEGLIDAVVAAARDGSLSHWLFDEQFYIRQRATAFADKICEPWEPHSSAYLDFLINGDRHDVRPHPLFCPTAYRSLNAHSGNGQGAFAHFVHVGQYNEFRTSALFDPEFYLALNPTVSDALREGRFHSALESFCRVGLTNGLSFSPDIDVDYYTRTNEEVARASSKGQLLPAWHFLSEGIWEGKRASPYFDAQYYLQRYPYIEEMCRRLSIASLEHFLLFGRFQGLRPSQPLQEREIDILQAKGLYERRALDSLIRLSRRPLDFTPFTSETPLLSIIVPVHDQLDFTARFLDLAYFACSELKRRTGAACEIIIVSNGSTDGTSDFVASFSGLQSIVTTEALGYPSAVNAGAKLAAGKYLLVVNNDVEFDPGIFADLVESFGKTPNCGALGPRILSMDMTIQESGSFVAPNGSTFGVGRGSRSSTMSGIDRDVVDYVSGCFLFLEREVFEALGGFDDCFSPGYYEEVDLCLRIAEELGKQVVLDLGLSILHYEHASFMKGRPPAVSYPLILRNRQNLLRKHPRISERSSLKKFRVSAGTPGNGGARKIRLLVIGSFIPDPRLGSRSSRTAEILRVLHERGVAFDVMALHPIEGADEYEFLEVTIFRDWMPGQSFEALLERETPVFSHIWLSGLDDLDRLTPLLRAYKDRHDAKIICDFQASSVDKAGVSVQELSNDPKFDLHPISSSGMSLVDRFAPEDEVESAIIRSLGI